jgi:hypothetical protein
MERISLLRAADLASEVRATTSIMLLEKGKMKPLRL